MKSFRETYESLKKGQRDATVAAKANLHKSTLSRIKNEVIDPVQDWQGFTGEGIKLWCLRFPDMP